MRGPIWLRHWGVYQEFPDSATFLLQGRETERENNAMPHTNNPEMILGRGLSPDESAKFKRLNKQITSCFTAAGYAIRICDGTWNGGRRQNAREVACRGWGHTGWVGCLILLPSISAVPGKRPELYLPDGVYLFHWACVVDFSPKWGAGTTHLIPYAGRIDTSPMRKRGSEWIPSLALRASVSHAADGPFPAARSRVGQSMSKTPLVWAFVFFAFAGPCLWPVPGSAADPEKATLRVAPNVFECSTPVTAAGELDRIVFAKLSSLGIRPVLCSDAVFVRRAYLDVIGTLPTAKEAREFIHDPDAKNKRRLLIDRLLERDEFADYWAMKWGDVLRIKAEFPVNLWPNAAQAYHRWVRASIAENKPYDKFVRELLTSSGSNFRVGPVNFYRAIQNRTPGGHRRRRGPDVHGRAGRVLAEGPAGGHGGLLLADRLQAHAASGRRSTSSGTLFTRVPLARRTSRPEKPDPKAKPGPSAKPAPRWPAPQSAPQTAVFPDGTKIQLPPDRDPREVFADWLITPKNPWFTRSIVNRVWAWLLGRGIIHEPDDIREDNPPSNPELLAYLEKELVASHYDLKRSLPA